MTEEKSDAAKPIIIKKYANRRLYNTSKSSYVTLDDLAQMVRDDADFVVNDAKSGEDITRSVLAQIIFEEEAKGASMLPPSFLRQLIRLYGDAMQGYVPPYLEASMETFLRNQEQMREQMRVTFGGLPAMDAFDAMTRTNMEWLQNAMRMFSPHSAAEPKAAPDEPTGGGELDDLKRRLGEMQSQLDRIAKR